jgi:hypothetical protein
VDVEDGRPGTMSEDKGPATLQVVVVNEPRLAIDEVALSLLVVEDLDEVQRLAAIALFHHDARQGIPPQGANKTGGSGRCTSHPARRWTMKVVNLCSET